MNEQTIFSTREAAAYLGMAESSLAYHLYTTGELVADGTVGGNLYFTRVTLDRFKEERRGEGMTTKEAADYLGITPGTLKQYVYRGKIEPDGVGKRGKGRGRPSLRFSKETLDAFRRGN